MCDWVTNTPLRIIRNFNIQSFPLLSKRICFCPFEKKCFEQQSLKGICILHQHWDQHQYSNIGIHILQSSKLALYIFVKHVIFSKIDTQNAIYCNKLQQTGGLHLYWNILNKDISQKTFRNYKNSSIGEPISENIFEGVLFNKIAGINPRP